MRTFRNHLLLVVLLAAAPAAVSASTIIDGWAVSIDGNLFTSFTDSPTVATQSDLMATGVLVDGTLVRITGLFDAGILDYQNGGGQIGGGMGLGGINVSLSGTGTHTVSVWVDHHFDVGQGPLFYNEFGEVDGYLPDGYSYTIDEPGYGPTGTAFAQNASQTFDNTNHLGQATPGDVSMAIGITHNLGNTGGARWTFSFNYDGPDYTQPGFFLPTGFHLTQSSTDEINRLYFSADVQPVPEPGTLYMPAGAALLLGLARLRKRTVTE